MKQRRAGLELLKLIGILLIFNSHIDSLYPIPALATGGAVGNSLFFILSGYFTKADDRSKFLPSFLRRVLRIYIVSWIGVLLGVVIEKEQILSFGDAFAAFVWPTWYWFGAAVLLFSLLLFVLENCGFRKHFAAYSIIMGFIYAAVYILFADKTQWFVETAGLDTAAGWFKCISYFYIFSLGNYFRNNVRLISDIKKGLVCIAAAAFTFACQLALKLVMMKIPALYSVQFLSQVCNIAFALFMLMAFLRLEEKCAELLRGRAGECVHFVSELSYEIYVAQFVVIGHCTGIIFPLNVICALGGTVLLAFCISSAAKLIQKLLSRASLREKNVTK